MLFKKSKLDWVEKRAMKDFQTVFSITNQGQNFAVVSIDMQKKYLDWIYPHNKQEILIEYHKKIKQLCNQNNIDFIEIEYKMQGRNVLRNKDSLFFQKDTDSAAFNNEFIIYLKQNKIKNLYVIGINRNNCVLSSIYYLQNRDYKIITSFLGTASSAEDYNFYKDKKEVKVLNNAYSQIYKENNMEIYSLRNNINLLLKNGVVILDYLNNNKMEILE